VCFTEKRTMAEATFRLVHHLFASYGLLVLLPDHPDLKRSFIPIIKRELLEQFTAPLVEEQNQALAAAGYTAQATPRSINLFYLQENSRQRLEKKGEQWMVQGTSVVFDRLSLLQEIEEHPERFSPNVMLRGLYQCTLLPDVVFVGGGAEISYWLQLKKLFTEASVTMPVLVLRNSFLLIESATTKRLANLGLMSSQLFLSDDQLLRHLVGASVLSQSDLTNEIDQLRQVYQQLQKRAGQLDPTLIAHVESLEKRSLQGLEGLEKKWWRVIKRKHQEQQNQMQLLKAQLFPGGQLQERHQHIGYFFAKGGRALIDELLLHSQGLTQEFTILHLTKS
ncbi:MAG: bacillithiol biosynthesis BshC, partial [Sphingomonadales bacterium]